LAVFAVPFMVAYGMVAYSFLLRGLPLPARLALAVLLGIFCGNFLLAKRKAEHIFRHVAEARFLGCGITVSGSLWNPFSVPVITIHAEGSTPQEAGALANVVAISGPDYTVSPRRNSSMANIAFLITFYGLAMRMIGAAQRPSLMAITLGVALALFLTVTADNFLALQEFKFAGAETAYLGRGAHDYQVWNFLLLEHARRRYEDPETFKSETRRILVERCGLNRDSAVLEPGAGGGFLWKHLPEELRPGWIELEKNLCAHTYAVRHGFGTRFINTDAKSTPFPPDSFDAIVGLECFDAFSTNDFNIFLKEALRVLKPGGLAVHLKDFPDYPGELIAARMNLFAKSVIGKTPVTYKTRAIKDAYLKFTPLKAGEIAALKEKAGDILPQFTAAAKTLADIYAAGPKSNPRFAMPMYLSIMIMKRAFADSGFEIVEEGDCKPYLAYLIARKPKQPAPSPQEQQA